MEVAPVELYAYLTSGTIVLALLLFGLLMLIDAPYGRYMREGWGPALSHRAGWILMELPAPIFMAVFYSMGENRGGGIPIFFLALFQLHYFHRAVVYPLLTRKRIGRIPVLIVLMALLFNSVNGSLCGWAVSEVGHYGADWLEDPRFLIGTLLFFVGAGINLQSDAILRRLREPGDTTYRIPRGGLYRWVTSPNYLGEIIEWAGFALATWSLAGLAFAVFTFANLAPRARSNQQWYRSQFADYPPERRALIPFLY